MLIEESWILLYGISTFLERINHCEVMILFLPFLHRLVPISGKLLVQLLCQLPVCSCAVVLAPESPKSGKSLVQLSLQLRVCSCKASSFCESVKLTMVGQLSSYLESHGVLWRAHPWLRAACSVSPPRSASRRDLFEATLPVTKFLSVVISVGDPDPGSSAFFTSASGMGKNPDP